MNQNKGGGSIEKKIFYFLIILHGYVSTLVEHICFSALPGTKKETKVLNFDYIQLISIIRYIQIT